MTLDNDFLASLVTEHTFSESSPEQIQRAYHLFSTLTPQGVLNLVPADTYMNMKAVSVRGVKPDNYLVFKPSFLRDNARKVIGKRTFTATPLSEGWNVSYQDKSNNPASTLVTFSVQDFDFYMDSDADIASRIISRLGQVMQDLWQEMRFGNLCDRIPSLVLTGGGGSCPYQADGTLDGYPFYFRARHGVATLSLAPLGGNFDPDGDGDSFSHPLYLSSLDHMEEFGEFLDDESFVKIFPRLVSSLERSTKKWFFASTISPNSPDFPSGKDWGYCERPHQRHSWGETAEEAWKELHFSPYEPYQKLYEKNLAKLSLNPVPSGFFEHDYPEVAPDFRVLDES